MTTQEVIKSLRMIKSTCYIGNRKFLDALEQAVEMLEAQEWIPVSERLPENDDAVLISHKHGVGKAWWNGRFWSSVTKKCYKTVTAWMPLPEPYRAERRTDG